MWGSIIISDQFSLNDALIKLDQNPIFLTLFVENSYNQIIGSITDGDIRRALLSGKTKESKVTEFYNEEFLFLTEGDINQSKINAVKQKGIKAIPLLTAERKLIRVINLQETESILPIDVVIMAGGKGTRLMPLTEKTPKPLLMVGDKPIIEHNIDRLKRFGVYNFYLSVNYLGNQLIDYFSNGNEKDIHIDYIQEDRPLGTIGSLSKNIKFENDYILVMNSDILTNIDYASMFQELESNQADMIVATTSYEVQIPYGVLTTNGQDIVKLQEKPTYRYYSNAGIYIIKKECKELIPEDTLYNATDLLEDLIRLNKKVIHYPIPGYWLDIGKPNDYKKAQEDIKHLKL